MSTISSDVFRILSDATGLPLQEIHRDLAIRSIPDIESIKILRAILLIEKQFNIEVPDDITFNVTTVGQFIDVVDDLCARRDVVPST